MDINQREQNPDVNSYDPNIQPGEDPGVTDTSNDRGDDIERKPETDVIPVPPDAERTVPIEAPPASDGPPVGDVDDSPKRIA
jgi:hypothetical protein